VAWVTGAGAGGGGGGGGAVVVVTGAGGGAGAVTVGAALVVVAGPDTVLVLGDDPEVDRAGAAVAGDCVEVGEPTVELEAPARATAAAAWAVAAAIEALIDVEIDDAVALAFCAVDVNVETIRRSLARVALRRASFCALSALCRETYAGTVVVVVEAVVGTVAPTKALASPVPMMATEVTTAVGRTRRRMVERSNVREVRARLAARR